MRNIKKKWMKITGALIVVLLIGPLIINLIYKMSAPNMWLVAEWSAGDALAAFTSISASLFAIYGISMSINASDKVFTQNVWNQMRPYIVADFLKTKAIPLTANQSSSIEAAGRDETKHEYKEYSLKSFYFIIEEDKKRKKCVIKPEKDLSEKKKRIIYHGGQYMKELPNGISIQQAETYLYLKMVLENVGRGVAIQTHVGLNNRDADESIKTFVGPVPLKVGESMSVGFYADNIDENSTLLGEYDFDIMYYDIYGNKYAQSHEITIQYDKEEQRAKGTVSTTHNQRLVEIVDEGAYRLNKETPLKGHLTKKGDRA